MNKIHKVEKLHLRIGSAPDNNLVVNQEGIDAHHLELFRDAEGNIYITDMDSKNGTTINGKKLVGYSQLHLGDKVVLAGKIVFKWEKYAPKEAVEVIEQKSREIEDKVEEKLQAEKLEKNDKKMNQSLIVIYSIVAILLITLFILL